MKPVKICHIADTHIRNLKFHKTYKEVFENLYAELDRLKPDIIVHCGDLAHSKNKISPEYVSLAGEFLTELANRAPLVMIPGNHDGIISNTSRMDSITPVVRLVDSKNPIHYLFDAESVELEGFEGIVFHSLSPFDRPNWSLEPDDPEKLNIALFHAPVRGCFVSEGFRMSSGDDVSIFEEFDFAFLGDIHISNQSMDEEGRVRYCGSTIQQNFGETDDKGFLFWEIEDKNNFKATHVQLNNPNPFITITEEDLSSIDFEKYRNKYTGSRIRLVTSTASDSTLNNFVCSNLKTVSGALSVVVKNDHSASPEARSRAKNIKNYRNLDTQHEIISKFLEDTGVPREKIEEILKLNKFYEEKLPGKKDLLGDVGEWTIKSLNFENLFNYRSKNTIEFTDLSGVIGIFGTNFSGKSSFLDSLCYSIYGDITKNIRKSSDLINNEEEMAKTKVELLSGDESYTIERCLKRSGKTAKSYLDFWKRIGSKTYDLSEEGTRETSKAVTSYFGSLSDFKNTNFLPQFDQFGIISEGSTKRKEILSQLLGLDLFSEKSSLAREELKYLKRRIAEYSVETVLKDIESLEQSLEDLRKESASSEGHISECAKTLEDKKNKLEKIELELEELDSKTSKYLRIKERSEEWKVNTKRKERELEKAKSGLESALMKLSGFSESEDSEEELEKRVAELRIEKEESLKHQRRLLDLDKTMLRFEESAKSYTSRPCGDSFPGCGFLKTVRENSIKYEAAKEKKNSLFSLEIRSDKEVSDDIQFLMGKLGEIKKNRDQLSNLNISKETLSLKIEMIEKDLEELASKLGGVVADEDAEKLISRLHSKRKEKVQVGAIYGAKLSEYDKLLEAKYRLASKIELTEQQLLELKKRRESAEGISRSIEIHKVYDSVVGPKGISIQIIEEVVPVINNFISDALGGVFGFDVFLEVNGTSLNIYVKHPGQKPRAIESSSGSERQIASIALKIALHKVSLLPKSDIFIMDEPGAFLDEKNKGLFEDIIAVLRDNFRIVFLITHLDELKDNVDRVINIATPAKLMI